MRPFDLSTLTFSGGAEPAADHLQYYDIDMSGTYSVSRNGVLIFEKQTNPSERIVLVPSTGSNADTLFNLPVFHDARLSQRDRQIDFDSYEPREKNYDIWIYNIARNVVSRLTLNANADVYPCWSVGGKEIIFSSNRGPGGNLNLFIKNADGSGNSSPLFRFDNDVIADQCSPNGRYVLLQAMDYVGKNSGWDLLLLPLRGTESPLCFSEPNTMKKTVEFLPIRNGLSTFPMSREKSRFMLHR